VSCTICTTRSARRFCPAMHERICPQCCGKEREVTLDCPSDCPYLIEARKHERRWAGEIDAAALLPEVDVRRQFLYEQEPLITGLTFAIAGRARQDRELHDRDVIAALTAMARNLQTLVDSGLHVPGNSSAPAQQAVIDALKSMVEQYRETEQKHLGYSTLRDATVLQAMVFILRMAHGHTSGRPRSRAFLDFIAGQFPQATGAGAQPGESKLVIP
jgi:hypothetical protein